MQDYIQPIVKDKPIELPENDTRRVVGYTNINGKMFEIDDLIDEQCCAKTVDINSRIRKYFIKCNPNGDLLNPWSAYPFTTQQKYEKQRGREYWQFKEVNELAFQHYIRFLETQNESHLLIADREARNA